MRFAAHLPVDEKVGTFSLQPLRNIHFYSEDIDNSAERNNSTGRMGDITYVYIFAVIGVFVLLIACINYINLTTARASRRAKEIGVRKVAGSAQGEPHLPVPDGIASHHVHRIFYCAVCGATDPT
jgi:hypothetical protein